MVSQIYVVVQNHLCIKSDEESNSKNIGSHSSGYVYPKYKKSPLQAGINESPSSPSLLVLSPTKFFFSAMALISFM
jgi:hypothetical protein